MKNIKGSSKLLTIALIALPALLGASNTYATDCKAKFKIINQWNAKNNGTQCEIKVKKIHIDGDKGSWNESIPNTKLMYGQSYTTSEQTLNKLSVGKTGSMTLHFDQKCHVGGSWKKREHGPFDFTCTTVNFSSTQNIFQFTVAR